MPNRHEAINKKIKYIHKIDIVGLKNIVFLLSQKRSNAEKYKALPLTIKTFLVLKKPQTLLPLVNPKHFVRCSSLR